MDAFVLFMTGHLESTKYIIIQMCLLRKDSFLKEIHRWCFLWPKVKRCFLELFSAELKMNIVSNSFPIILRSSQIIDSNYLFFLSYLFLSNASHHSSVKKIDIQLSTSQPLTQYSDKYRYWLMNKDIRMRHWYRSIWWIEELRKKE